MNLNLEWNVDDMSLANGVKGEIINREAQVWVWCSGCRWPSDRAWTLGEGTLRSQDVDGQSGQGEDERLTWEDRKAVTRSWGQGKKNEPSMSLIYISNQEQRQRRQNRSRAGETGRGGRRRMTTDRMGLKGETVMRVRASGLRRREEWN